ncbi:MAG TPA: glutamine--fructose-6-phosphate transaminase (isomerizing) [Alphaproteobacteria bacterium]|nr:glutamine--fructose-6-phosphate transaminase (isomerizing) [Alphaproteobacteria bacterium]
MCGIVGIVGKEDVAPIILDSLKRLEYRGYDSAGIATLTDARIERRRAPGKLRELGRVLSASPLKGRTGIGHTRWATHGAPNETNAHPHASDRCAVVHNGIIENFRELRAELEGKGHKFETETDTEVAVHLITEYMRQGLDAEKAASTAIKRLTGAYALAIIFRGDENLMIGARKGSPLAVGFGDGEMYLGSDAMALAPLTNRVLFLEEGDWVVLNRDNARVYDVQDRPANREVRTTQLSGSLVDKGPHRHFMAKEIFEQPEVIGNTLSGVLNPVTQMAQPPKLPFDFAHLSRVTIVACGTSYYAAMVAKYWFEQAARLPAEIDVASEFRYREAPMPKGGLAIFVSQSGETADTLAALRYARSQGQYILSIVNVPESSIARESDVVVPTHAGPEIGVASTKAFTCQLSVLAALAIAAGVARGALSRDDEMRLTRVLMEIPRHINEVLGQSAQIEAICHDIAKARDVLYLGRGLAYPIALEGALKLKEISYIHAEGYAAGEMKHGPIALIDEHVPIIVIAPYDALYEKTISNMQESMARGGKVLLMSDAEGIRHAGDKLWHTIEMPKIDPFVAPILYAIPVQLLAYHTAVAKGTDVDQPRNLAKSVTVE